MFTSVAPHSYGPMTLPVPDPASFSPAVALIAVAAAIALFRFRVGMLWVLAGGAVAGIALHLLGVAGMP